MGVIVSEFFSVCSPVLIDNIYLGALATDAIVVDVRHETCSGRAPNS